MAELSIKLNCKTPALKRGYTAMCVLFPVWTIVLPSLLGVFIAYALSGVLPLPLVVGIFIGICFLIGLGFIMTAVTDETELKGFRDGLVIPVRLMPKVGYRRSWKWSDLTQVDFSELVCGKRNLILRLNNMPFEIDLAYLKERQLEEFLLAVDLLAPACPKSVAAIEMQKQIQQKEQGEVRGYTEMWEDELTRRFHSTAFVPLDADCLLQNNKYKILRQLAFGGLSAVYLAQRDKTDLVVLKEAVVPANASPELKKRSQWLLQRESQMLFCLYHPCIARVMDYFVEDERHYLVLEYIPGQDLKQLIRQRGPQEAQLVLSWAIMIAEILVFLHTQDPPIIHRDLTPDNLMLKNDGSIVLIDFGVSNEFLGTVTGTVVGKQCYIAPEQMRGKTTLQSDLYALGCTLHFLLTGADPIPLSRSHPRLVNPKVDEQFDNLVADLTALETSERLESAASVVLALNKLYKSKALVAD